MHTSHTFLNAYYVSGILLDAGMDSQNKEIGFAFEISRKCQHNFTSAIRVLQEGNKAEPILGSKRKSVKSFGLSSFQ